MQPTIRRIQPHDSESFRACLDSVARERKYLAQVEAPPLEKVREFVAQSVEQDAAQYVALVDEQVIGWCDVRGGPACPNTVWLAISGLV